uniref:Uncharacterized protein n=1 Tax=Aegilops tauschii TaxID=37682 RepID=M8BS05_AEGTA
MAPGPPPTLPDELVEEILLRIPPDDPASLLRASIVCKSWREFVSHGGFHRRLHDLHRAPPVLGFLHDWYDEDIPRFIPATVSPFSLAAPDRWLWQAVDCRHRRGLFLSDHEPPYTKQLLVWDPITGAQQPVLVPAAFQRGRTTAAVFCTAGGCDHHDCQGAPFCVVQEADATWVPSRIIYLGSLSLNGVPVGEACPAHVLGFAEGANVIVVTTAAGLFTIQVQSGQATRVCDDDGYVNLPDDSVIDRILQSLPPSYKSFMMNYDMQGMDKTVPELFAMLKAAEVEIKKGHQVLMVNKTTSFRKKGKGKKGNFKKNDKQVAAQVKKPKSGPKPETECFYCKGSGHWKRNCPKYLADKKDSKVNKAPRVNYSLLVMESAEMMKMATGLRRRNSRSILFPDVFMAKPCAGSFIITVITLSC